MSPMAEGLGAPGGVGDYLAVSHSGSSDEIITPINGPSPSPASRQLHPLLSAQNKGLEQATASLPGLLLFPVEGRLC